jgi:hypothetical protein
VIKAVALQRQHAQTAGVREAVGTASAPEGQGIALALETL